MKHKKFISTILASCMLSGVHTVFAEEGFILNSIEVVDAVGNTVVIKGKIPTPDAKVYLEITRKGSNIDSNKDIYLAKTVTSDENGEFTTSCDMPEKDRNTGADIDGYFTLYAGASGYDKKSVDFIFVHEENRITFFNGLNNAGNFENFDAFMANSENVLEFEGYGIECENYISLTQSLKEKVYETVKEFVFTKENIQELNETILAMRLNGLADKSLIVDVLENATVQERCNLVYENVAYSEETEENKDWFCEIVLIKSKNNDFEKITELNDLYTEAMLLRQVNTRHYSEIYQILKDNSTFLGLDGVNEFNSIGILTSDQINDVMKNLNNISRNIMSKDVLKTSVINAYNTFIATVNGGNNYGGTTGGSGGSGGSSNSFPSGGKSNGMVVGGGVVSSQTSVSETDAKKDYFNDIAGYEWAEEAINALAARNVVSGYGDGSFAPEKNVTRAEFIKMLLDAFELKQNDAECVADDVPANDWSYRYVASAYALGITSGVDENNFGKNNPITRQEAATFLHRAAVRAYLPIERNSRDAFSDYHEIAEWARNSVNIMYEAGVINGVGDNRFDPQGMTTRVQAAKMIYELYKYIS